jgi:EAL domain-containing protein (putative c-di-GMP-specific phosphodiesterase class I)
MGLAIRLAYDNFGAGDQHLIYYRRLSPLNATVQDIGIHYFQGDFFGRPTEMAPYATAAHLIFS